MRQNPSYTNYQQPNQLTYYNNQNTNPTLNRPNLANPQVNPTEYFGNSAATGQASYYNNNSYNANQYNSNNKKINTKDRDQGVHDLRQKFPQGITLSWNVNVYVEKKSNFIEKIKNKCKRGKKEEKTQVVSNLQTFGGSLQQNKVQSQAESTNIKRILKNVSGIVKPGQLCAIMGASGSGKTTLLNVLNFRNRGNLIIKDDIRVNGRAVKPDEIPEYSGYVQQMDLFVGTLTVKEQLMFYAMLRMDRHLTNEQKIARVEEVINQLNLIKCQDSKIGMGDLTKRISGGEKRRLAFGAEIINNPPLLFADEPTSGLDTFMALTVTDILDQFAKQGKTIVCTIHQPSSQIFEKFDTLCLLSEGRVAYLGPRQEAYNFFSRLGYRCPSTYNPADYYIQVLAIRPTNREECLEKTRKVCDAYESSEYKQRITQSIAMANASGAYTSFNDSKRSWYSASYATQLRWLGWRESLNVLRNPIATYILLAQTIFIAIFLGLVFLQIKLSDQGVQNYVGVLFVLLMQTNFGYIFAIVNSLPSELPVLYREVKNRTYSVYIYYLAKNIAETPKLIITPFILVTIVFWMSGISNNVSVFFIVASILVLNTQVAIGFGLFLSIAAPNINIALALSIPILIPLLIFGGFFLNADSTPNFMIWLKYLSWFFYANEAASVEYWKSVDYISCTQPPSNNTCSANRCFRNGDDVLTYFLNFNKDNVGRDVGILFLFFVAYRVFALLILRLKSHAR